MHISLNTLFSSVDSGMYSASLKLKHYRTLHCKIYDDFASKLAIGPKSDYWVLLATVSTKFSIRAFAPKDDII